MGISIEAYRFFSTFSWSSSPSSKSPKISEQVSLVDDSKKDDPAGLSKLSSEALSATYDALQLWFQLILSILIPASDHSLVYAKQGWSTLEPSIRLSWYWLIYESSMEFRIGVSLVLIVGTFLWMLRREIKRRRIVERVSESFQRGQAYVQGKYFAVRNEIARESRIAANILPHFIYFLVSLTSVVLFRDVSTAFATGWGAWLVIVGWPWIGSYQRLVQYRGLRLMTLDVGSTSDSQFKKAVDRLYDRIMHEFPLDTQKEPEQRKLTKEDEEVFERLVGWLQYWAIFSVPMLLEQFPLTGHFLGVFPYWPEVRVVFALWLLLPFTRGRDVAFHFIVPLWTCFLQLIPFMKARGEGLNGSLLFAPFRFVLNRFLSPERIDHFMECLEMDYSLLWISVPFLISPSFVTQIGVLIVGLAYPSNCSSFSILQGSERHNQRNTITSWLEYWLVYVVFTFWHGKLDNNVFGWWFPLWDQIHLSILMWMQLSYTRGAHRVFWYSACLIRVFQTVWALAFGFRHNSNKQQEEQPPVKTESTTT